MSTVSNHLDTVDGVSAMSLECSGLSLSRVWRPIAKELVDQRACRLGDGANQFNPDKEVTVPLIKQKTFCRYRPTRSDPTVKVGI